MADETAGTIHIVGAGPAGLTAALTVARAGRRAVVHEQRPDVGGRFHGDLQGIENWTSRVDVLEELEALGVEPSFDSRACRDGVFYDPEGREFLYRSARPLFHVVRRGRDPGTLDQQLKAQALAAGVEIRFRDPVRRLPQGGIVAGGPRGPDAIAVGYVFETDRADGVFGVLSDRLAPKGYSYLLVWRGRGTVASCLFDDFHREKEYLERTVAFFRANAGLQMRNPVRFGGTGNVLLPTTARHDNILFAGEAAGFQDALWGFGMRLAMVSGHLAARALLAGAPADYDRLWRRRLGDLLRVSIANRYAFSRMGDRGYVRLMRSIGRAGDARQWLHDHYAPSLWKRLLFPLARRATRSRRSPPGCALSGCDCTWCRAHPHPEENVRRFRARGPAAAASHPPRH
ncbi:MAG TPA: NAD(P)/FAD-dependent oxidoreductase [Thermoanaerobaculia bacterium]|nr:NAD(P)/FAD-dependent oxidoreductase [Thermoanaerobaculia bacterium]